MDFLLFTVAIAILIWGADMVVDQSEKVALKFHIPEFIIGATLVALGTSLPEMAASMAASASSKPEIAISNVIGSNILNITLVLASVFLITKTMNPNRDFFAKDSTWALVPVFVFILMSFDNTVSRFDALLLLLVMFAYILFLVRDSKEVELTDEEVDMRDFSWKKVLPLLILGLLFVIVGAHYTVESASSIAKSFGISEWLIGILLISLGTSLPELTVSVVAARKGKVDMAIGNIIGSNMANTTIVLGAAALVAPLQFTASNYLFDITTMVIATLLLVFLTANKLYTKPAGVSLFIILALFLNHAVSQL
jgi:cation:H+ antiporter